MCGCKNKAKATLQSGSLEYEQAFAKLKAIKKSRLAKTRQAKIQKRQDALVKSRERIENIKKINAARSKRRARRR